MYASYIILRYILSKDIDNNIVKCTIVRVAPRTAVPLLPFGEKKYQERSSRSCDHSPTQQWSRIRVSISVANTCNTCMQYTCIASMQYACIAAMQYTCIAAMQYACNIYVLLLCNMHAIYMYCLYAIYMYCCYAIYM